MNFAILGGDKLVAALAEAIGRSTEHRVTAVCEVDHATRAAAPEARVLHNWDELLDQNDFEAVVVGHENSERRADQLRVLVQAEIPLLASMPVHDSMLVAIELEMIRESVDGVIEPFSLGFGHPAIERLRAWLAGDAASPIGDARQLHFERTGRLGSREAVLADFVRDADLLCAVGEYPTRASAMSSNDDLRELSVQMHGPSGLLSRWSAMQSATEAHGKLEVLGATGRAVLHMPAEGAWSLETTAGEETTREMFPDWDPASHALERFVHVVRKSIVSNRWRQFGRLMELADAVERSVKKGRTIDLHYEEHTEEGNFKGIMAAGGCLLLVAVLCIAVMMSIVGGFNLPLLRFWPHALVALLGAFLLLQTLKLAYPADDNQSARDRGADE